MKDERKHFELFEKCVTKPHEGEWWEKLFEILALRPKYREFLPLVLYRGGWRLATDPVRYVRSAVSKESRRQERRRSHCTVRISDLDLRGPDGRPLGDDAAFDNLQSFEDQGEASYVEFRVRRELRGGEGWDEDERETIDYTKLMDEVAARATLNQKRRDAVELVLRLRGREGLTRVEVLNCPPDERKRRQAAWKWIERNHALLADVLAAP